MLVSTLIHDLKMRGLYMHAKDDRLYISPAEKIPDSLRPKIKEMKDKLILFLEQWEERAAIMEYDAGMTRQDAENKAYKDLTNGGQNEI